jgi:hypothetical protein
VSGDLRVMLTTICTETWHRLGGALTAGQAAGHPALQPGTVLGAVNALRSASPARFARPSGIDRACAQRRTLGSYVMAGLYE